MSNQKSESHAAALVMRRHRRAAEITQKDLAKAMGCSERHVRNLESGTADLRLADMLVAIGMIPDLTMAEMVGVE